MRRFLLLLPFLMFALTASHAQAQGRPYVRSSYALDVGLGIAGGVAYVPSSVQKGSVREESGTGYSWGFFVDIPLLETFYISPSAILYDIDLGEGRHPATDIDLAFKFIAPVGRVHLGVGAIVGLTEEELEYDWHLGALAYASLNVVANIDVFVLAQYKRIFRGGMDLDDVHGFAGLMFVL